MDRNYLKECVEYDALTGNFTWKERPLNHFSTERGWKTFNSQRAGKIVGTKNLLGYLQCFIDKKLYLLHRLVFIYEGLDITEDSVDHINHNRQDNRRCNLRVVSRSENNKNLTKRRSNTSGITGVRFENRDSLWYARIQVNYKNIHLGCTKDLFEACCLRKSAEVFYNFHNNHGV